MKNQTPPQCYSDSLKRPKRMTGKVVSCQDSNNVTNNQHTGEKGQYVIKRLKRSPYQKYMLCICDFLGNFTLSDRVTEI